MTNFKRRRRFTLLFLFTCAISALTWGLTTLVHLPELQLKKVLILGTHYTSPDSISEFCLQHQDKNIIGLLLNRKFRQNLYGEFPQIDEVQFGFQWPNTLTLAITEKKPFAVFMTSPLKLCSKDGTVLQIIDSSFPVGKSCIHIFGVSEKWVQKQVPEPLMQKVASIADCLHKSNVTANIVFKHVWLSPAGNMDDVVVLKENGTAFKIGPTHDLESKFQRLNAMLSHIKATEPSKSIQYIDLRVPNKVIVKYG